MEIAEIAVNFKGGGSFVDLPPRFSSCGENIYVAWRDAVVGYSSITGKEIAQFKVSDGRVVGFDVCTLDSTECIVACNEKSEATVWKATTQFKIRTKKFGKKFIQGFKLSSSESIEDLKAVVPYRGNNVINFGLVNVMKGGYLDYKLSINNQFPYIYDVAKTYFSVVQGNIIYFIKIDNFNKVWRTKISNRQFTCISCHPEDESVLTGDNHGRIVLWRSIFSRSPCQTVYHWHSLPTRAVAFSTSGSYFYSGGWECVLVRWQAENSFERKYLPRLASSIVNIAISEDNSKIAVATADNGVSVVDARFNLITLVQHLAVGNLYSCGIVHDTRTNAVVMNGSVGQVQFFSPQDMSLVYKVDIVGVNKVTGERDAVVEDTQVVKLALSKSGLWMAVVEERRDDRYTSDLRLKFFRFSAEKQNFELNTSIERPHEGPITEIALNPTATDDDPQCTTVSRDENFKIWHMVEIDSVHNKRQVWNCFLRGYFRQMPCKGLSYSWDGSLIGVGFGPILTLWDPETCDLRSTLSLHTPEIPPNERLPLQEIAFGNYGVHHLVTVTTKEYLLVWNIISDSVVFHVNLQVELLVADRFSQYVAVIDKNRAVYVFSPDSPKLVYKDDKLLADHPGDILAAAFVPTKYNKHTRLQWYQRSHLFFVDSNRELYSLGEGEEYSNPVQEVETVSSSLFSKMQSKSSYRATSDAETATTPIATREYEEGLKAVKAYLYSETPIYAMPPISMVCYDLLMAMAMKKENT